MKQLLPPCCGCGHIHWMPKHVAANGACGWICPCCGPVFPCAGCNEKRKRATAAVEEAGMSASEIEALILASQLAQANREKVAR